MNRETINQMRLAALHCDDYSQYIREMREVARLEREHGITRPKPQAPKVKAQRRSTGRRKAASIGHAIAMMEGKA